jgi:hypothetical protein
MNECASRFVLFLPLRPYSTVPFWFLFNQTKVRFCDLSRHLKIKHWDQRGLGEGGERKGGRLVNSPWVKLDAAWLKVWPVPWRWWWQQYCNMLPESRNIGFGQLRHIRHNTPLKALRGQWLRETFPKQWELKTCFHNNQTIENPVRRCSLSRWPEPTSREDREHSENSRVNIQSSHSIRRIPE